MIYLGLDPGATGAITAMQSDGVSFETLPLSKTTEQDIVNFLLGYTFGARAVLEKLHGRGGPNAQWAAGVNFKLGGSYYALRMALAAMSIPMIEAVPTVWQKQMLGGGSKGNKHTAQARACDMTGRKVRLWEADAVLLALYAIQRWKPILDKEAG